MPPLLSKPMALWEDHFHEALDAVQTEVLILCTNSQAC